MPEFFNVASYSCFDVCLFSFAPWCPACKNLGPIWEDFSKWQDDLDIKVGHIDVTVDVGLSGRFMVTALPTIFQ
jgi:thioredoxin-like negative regulator of GroEL